MVSRARGITADSPAEQRLYAYRLLNSSTSYPVEYNQPLYEAAHHPPLPRCANSNVNTSPLAIALGILGHSNRLLGARNQWSESQSMIRGGGRG